jgi:ribosomal protein S18 acetylase RimI-like enzyme
MAQPLTIRPATLQDVDAIAALLTELNRTEGQEVVADAHAIAQALFADEREVKVNALVAVDAQKVIGTLLYYAGYDTFSVSYGFHLADMVITESHRRHGVGSALVRALGQQVLAQGKAWISLTALKQNTAARGFYHSLGMTEVSVDFFAIGKQAITQL